MHFDLKILRETTIGTLPTNSGINPNFNKSSGNNIFQ